MFVEDRMSADSLESAIQASIAAGACRGRDHERVGPFFATFNRDTDNPFLNYAIPDIGAAPTPADVQALVAAYQERNRTPRLEYIPSLAPAVEPVLASGGFAVERRMPLMICAAASDVRDVTIAGVDLLAPSAEEEYRAAAFVQWEAYEERGEVQQRAVDALRRTAEAGGVVVLARDVETQHPAGAGLCTDPEDGLSELSSVAVRVPFRRRGIAAAMASWLAKEAFATGARGVFLTPHGESEERIYARAGFVSRSEVLHISRT